MTDFIRGVSGLLLTLVLLQAWILGSNISAPVTTYQSGSEESQAYLVVVLFLDSIALGIIWICDALGYMSAHPASSFRQICCAKGLNFMVLLYVTAVAVSWLELLALQGAPPPPEGGGN